MKNYFSKLREGKNLITVSKFLLIAVLLLGSHFAFACTFPPKVDGNGSKIGSCQAWSCPEGFSCGTGAAGNCVKSSGNNPDHPENFQFELTQKEADTVYSESGCAAAKMVHQTAFFLNQDIVSPVPDMSTTEPNQYVFKAYPDNSSQLVLGQNTNFPIPVNDPFSIGNLNLNGPIVNGTSNDNTVSIDANGNVPQVFSYLDFSTHVVWPPTGIFANVQLWNNSLAGTFKTFLSNTWANNFASNSKWYPLNYLTMDNPASMLPLIPVKLMWTKPALAPNAVAYHLNIQVAGNPLGIDTNISNDPNANASGDQIDIPVLNATTYTFTGRSMVSYYWSAQPLDAAGNVIPGPEIISTGTGSTENPYFKNTPGFNSVTHPVTNYANTINLGWTAGHTYFAEQGGASAWSSFDQNYTDYNPVNTFLYDGNYTAGKRPAYPFIEWPRMSNAVSYEIQYANVDIPDGTPFVDGATFTYTSPLPPFGTEQVVTHVINLANCPNCGLHESDMNYTNTDDLMTDRPGFQFNFNGTTIPENNATINHAGYNDGLHWRVRGVSVNNLPIRKSIYPHGFVTPPAPVVPFQVGRPVWARNNVATTSSTTGRVVKPTTGYVVDMVRNIADFDKLPKLDGVTIDPTVARDGNISTTENNTFLLRKIVPEKNYDAGSIITKKLKENINSARTSYVNIGLSNGDFDQLEIDAPFMTTMYNSSIPSYIDNWADYYKYLINNDNTSGLISDTNILDADYPKMVDTLGVNFLTSTATNKIVFTTNTPIKVTSTGTASIGIAQSQDKKTTTLTFAASSGYYAFNVTTIATSNSYPNLAVPISYDIYGTTALPVLTNKATTEFLYLLPGTTYYWRQRCIMDPDPESLNTGATKMTFCAWSTPQSITTPTGMPASITVTPTSTAKITASLKNSGLSKKDLQAEINNLKNSSFDIVPAKAQLKGPIKPLDLSKVKPTATQQMKIDPAQLKARVSATQALRKAYEGILNARNSKDGAMLKTAETNFKNAINNLLRQGGSKNLSAAAALSIDSSLLNTMASKITVAIILLFLIIAIAKMYSNWKLKKKEKEDSDNVNM